MPVLHDGLFRSSGEASKDGEDDAQQGDRGQELDEPDPERNDDQLQEQQGRPIDPVVVGHQPQNAGVAVDFFPAEQSHPGENVQLKKIFKREENRQA